MFLKFSLTSSTLFDVSDFSTIPSFSPSAVYMSHVYVPISGTHCCGTL